MKTGVAMEISLEEIKGGTMMNKKKWIIGLSIASVMALSGTAFALSSGSVVAQSVAQTLGLAPTFATTQNQGTVADTNGSSTANTSSSTRSQSTNTTPSSSNNNSNGETTPGSNGFAGGYGMMGGQGAYGNGGGMMGGGQGSNGYGGGYGMMGGQGSGNNNALDAKNENSAAKDMAASLTNATVDKSANTITYTGTDVKIVMLGGPEEADGKFVIADLINPTLRIPKGANVTMEIINEDKGMSHGLELTNAQPPYAYMSMMQGGVYPGAFIQTIAEAVTNQYPSAQVTFKTSYAGEFYYICQYPGHAAKGMYGKIIIG